MAVARTLVGSRSEPGKARSTCEIRATRVREVVIGSTRSSILPRSTSSASLAKTKLIRKATTCGGGAPKSRSCTCTANTRIGNETSATIAPRIAKIMMARGPDRMRLKLSTVDSFEPPWTATAVRSYCRTRLHAIGENVGPEVLADAAIGHAWRNSGERDYSSNN